MHEIENKRLWKDEMSFGGDTWYMDRIFEELKIMHLPNIYLHNELGLLIRKVDKAQN